MIGKGKEFKGKIVVGGWSFGRGTFIYAPNIPALIVTGEEIGIAALKVEPYMELSNHTIDKWLAPVPELVYDVFDAEVYISRSGKTAEIPLLIYDEAAHLLPWLQLDLPLRCRIVSADWLETGFVAYDAEMDWFYLVLKHPKDIPAEYGVRFEEAAEGEVWHYNAQKEMFETPKAFKLYLGRRRVFFVEDNPEEYFVGKPLKSGNYFLENCRGKRFVIHPQK